MKDQELEELRAKAHKELNGMYVFSAVHGGCQEGHAARYMTALEAKLAQKWLPIESAPKDGREILCFDPTEDGTFVILRYTVDIRQPELSGWRVAHWCHDDDKNLDWEPVCWQPIELSEVPPPTGESEEIN